jgi:ankyrin repeat protein
MSKDKTMSGLSLFLLTATLCVQLTRVSRRKRKNRKKREKDSLVCYFNALLGACVDGDLASIKAVIEGIPEATVAAMGLLEVRDKNGFTPLILAAANGHLDVVKYLCDKGAQIEVMGTMGHRTPLHGAALKGHLDIVKLLCARGANVHAVGDMGDTPLIWAAEYGQISVVQYLCEQGAGVEAMTSNGSTTPLMTAAYVFCSMFFLLFLSCLRLSLINLSLPACTL